MPALAPGQSLLLRLTVTAPTEPGDWVVTVDAVDRPGERASRSGSPMLQVPLTTIAPPPSLAPPTGLRAPPPPERTQQQVVLEQLAKQIEALQAARNALKEGEAVRNGDERNYQRYLDRVQGLRDVVTRQEGVVEALQDQLRLLGSASLVE